MEKRSFSFNKWNEYWQSSSTLIYFYYRESEIQHIRSCSPKACWAMGSKALGYGGKRPCLPLWKGELWKNLQLLHWCFCWCFHLSRLWLAIPKPPKPPMHPKWWESPQQPLSTTAVLWQRKNISCIRTRLRWGICKSFFAKWRCRRKHLSFLNWWQISVILKNKFYLNINWYGRID